MADWTVIERAGLTQQEVADLLGVSRMTVWKWRCGMGQPTETREVEVDALFTKLEAGIKAGTLPLDVASIRETTQSRVQEERIRQIRAALS